MRRALPLVLLSLLASACAVSPRAPQAAPASERAALSAEAVAASEVLPVPRPGAAGTTSSVPAESAPITFAFGGDVHGEKMIRARLDRDPASVFGPISATLRKADIAMVNLETAITERGAPEPKQYTFRAPRRIVDAMRAAGVDVASVANNHGVDYGRQGLLDTLRVKRETRFPLVGVGSNKAEAYSAWRTTVRGTSVSVLGATQVLDSRSARHWPATDSRPGLASAYDQASLLTAVRRETKVSTIVVVYLHWGQERATCPSSRQMELAKRLREAGAEIVVGAHAHVLQGEGFLGGSYIHYGLGNFVWYSGNAPTGVITLSANPRTGRVASTGFVPARVHNGQPIPTGASKAQTDRERARLRGCTNLAAKPY